MATFKPYLNPTVKKDGTRTVLLRITKNRKHVTVSLEFSLKPNQWNSDTTLGNYVRNNHPLSAELNQKIQNEINAYQKMEIQNQPYSAFEIKALRKKENQTETEFLGYCKEYLSRIEVSKSISTYRKRKSVVTKLKDFLGSKPLPFNQITVSLLMDFEKYLYSIGNGKNTVGNHVRIIRTILYSAIKEGKFDQGKNPFFGYTIAREKVNKEKLTEDEIKSIEELTVPKNSLTWHVRNCFLFSYYNHGMRSGDVIRLKWSSIQSDRLIYQMGKTKMIKDIRISRKALAILKMYSRSNKRGYVFPFLVEGQDDQNELMLFNRVSAKNALINKYLKKIAGQSKIKKNLSFHIARHSFASIARDKTHDLSAIQKALGHTSIKVTEIYLNTLSNDQLDEFSEKVYKE